MVLSWIVFLLVVIICIGVIWRVKLVLADLFLDFELMELGFFSALICAVAVDNRWREIEGLA